MSYQHIKFEIQSSVGKITLNRPEVLNSFNRQMSFELQNALDKCATDKSVRAVYITGEGRGFSAGQDLAEAVANKGAIKEIVNIQYNPIIKKLRSIEKPVVCAVNGVAAGAGANIAIACDITVAGSSATFIQSFSKIGLIPDSAGTFFLPRLIGPQRAAALMMLGDKITAEQAFNIGLIYQVIEDASLYEKGFAIAAQLAAMPTRGLALTKQALNQSLENSLDEQLALEEELQSQAGNSFDHKEGVQAFLEKRKPVFKGE